MKILGFLKKRRLVAITVTAVKGSKEIIIGQINCCRKLAPKGIVIPKGFSIVLESEIMDDKEREL